MICRHCGKVTELHDPALMNARVQSIHDAGHPLDHHEVEILCICPDCR